MKIPRGCIRKRCGVTPKMAGLQDPLRIKPKSCLVPGGPPHHRARAPLVVPARSVFASAGYPDLLPCTAPTASCSPSKGERHGRMGTFGKFMVQTFWTRA